MVRRLSFLKIWSSLSLLVFCSVCMPIQARTTVVYPRWDKQDTRQVFFFKMLKLALEKDKNDIDLQASRLLMDQGRALVQLSAGKDVDVVWTMTSKQRESELLPIRIPLDKGLIGWRIFLIKQKDVAAFSKIQSLQDLKKFEAGQGHDWPDTEILRAAGLPVQTSANYDGMFKKLVMGRYDYFPRSVTEIWAEINSNPDMGMVVDQSVLLQYPAAFYFFVNKKNEALAKKIEAGLRLAIKDGRFNQLFTNEFGADLARANLKKRTLIKLDNPFLPPETPLQDDTLWFSF